MLVPDAGDAVGNGDARQAAAVRECVTPMLVTLSGMVTLVRLVQSWNALIPMLVTLLGMSDARQASAVMECVIPDAGDAVGNGDARQAVQLENAYSRCW